MASEFEGMHFLPPELRHELMDFPDRAFAETAAQYESVRNKLRSGSNGDESFFTDAMALKRFIDAADKAYSSMPLLGKEPHEDDREPYNQTAVKQSATFLNAEYVLFHLHARTALPLNPFLSHWVDNIARWEGKATNTSALVQKAGYASEERLCLAKILLMEHYPPHISETSPSTFIHTPPPSPEFSLDTWLKTFPPTSPIYKDADALAVFKSSISSLYPTLQLDTANGDALSQRRAPQSLDANDVLAMFKADAAQTTLDIIHMPIDSIRCLELVNELLARERAERLLDALGVDAVGMVRDYIQHGLRQIEEMGCAPATRNAGTGGAPREEQTRAIQLLCAFVKNLLRRDYVSIAQIRFELLELAMRYCWVRDVREDLLFANSGEALWAV